MCHKCGDQSTPYEYCCMPDDTACPLCGADLDGEEQCPNDDCEFAGWDDYYERLEDERIDAALGRIDE